MEKTDLITCPHCGDADPQSWEIQGSEDGEVIQTSCESCHRTFFFVTHINVTYSTFKDYDSAQRASR